MLMGRADLAALIPHSGSMCLLESVLSWDSRRIRCTAASHRSPDNPLRHAGRLAAVCGVEYASQAMAVHGGLTAGGKRPAAGYLASLRDLACHADRLDDVTADLLIEAENLTGDGSRVIYGFSIHADGALLLSGRAAVVIDAGER
ncbi:phosphotransferase [Azospirillum picis]|uniref:Hotdog family 3-hydroxylacyl-ACP dehydratase n=1 Tax=Azospirillum picis TaxID=488438 RepID=A0ABU0MQC8_9PROT|nr:phosphotransferase [Azospirillum picis]MBP2302036.1 putative hotdog family 3-hydroxylacyl-ACP dehydratase [Azospirillum picis]MDQ0535673.1 putative hotdog family 3-hydroxylacyl-ACP dehydratase [Azospirillum picis]